jgi:hypothetical protein
MIRSARHNRRAFSLGASSIAGVSAAVRSPLPLYWHPVDARWYVPIMVNVPLTFMVNIPLRDMVDILLRGRQTSSGRFRGFRSAAACNRRASHFGTATYPSPNLNRLTEAG